METQIISTKLSETMKESVETVLKELVTIPTSTSTIHLKDSAVAIV